MSHLLLGWGHKNVEQTELCVFKGAVLAAKVEGWSIVLPGYWNRRILTPQWVGGGRLTKSEEIQVEIAVDDIGAPRRLVFDDIILEVHGSRIVVKPSKPTDELLKRIQGVSQKLLAELSHTPILAMGVNFTFLEESPSAKLTRLFDLQDVGGLADNEWIVNSSVIKRELVRNGKVLNLLVSLQESGTVGFEGNYHFPVKNTAEALSALDFDIIAIKNEFQSLITNLYSTEEK